MLSPEEKHNVVRLLGWPGTVLIETSLDYNNIVNGRLNNLNDPIESELRELLDRVISLDQRLREALDRALVTDLEGIKLNPEETNILRRERKRIISEISALLALANVSCSSNMVSIII